MGNATSHPKSPSPTDVHVGQRIRMRRLMLGMSQSTLARGLGLTFQQVQKYEKGANRVSASMLSQISDILQAPIPFFFDGTGESATHSDTLLSAMLATRDGLALVDAFTKLDDGRLRRGIIKLVEEMA